MQDKPPRQQRWLKLHYALATGCLLFLLSAIWVTARDGLSSSLSRSAPTDVSGLNRLDRAIQLSPSDSQPYKLRARYFVDVGRLADAERDFESAIVRSPHDYLLWLSLAETREKSGDPHGAVAAYHESIRLAPSFAKPHWDLGTLWLKMGNREDAFAELRRGAATDFELFAQLIRIAWEQYEGDPQAVRHAVQPQSLSQRVTLADSFFAKGKISEAIDLYRAVGKLPEAERRTLIARLLEAKKFAEAYEVRLDTHPEAYRQKAISLINDGGFENEIDDEGSGFNWQVERSLKSISVVRDNRQPQSGSFSLRVDFDGDSDAEICSQLMLTEASSNYELSFAARTQQLITGGPPVVVVVDANDGEVLAQSKPLTERQTEWGNQSLKFLTGRATQAVTIMIKRQPCSTAPCPAFGHAWFDNFTCKKL